MAKVLEEYFGAVAASDIYPYGYGSEHDFFDDALMVDVDWIITNPPFKHAEEFATKALSVANRGVAIFARSVFSESVGRHERLFSKMPPTMVAQFTERVPIVKGRLDARASTATGYAWFVWEKPMGKKPEFVWIPRSRKVLERAGDYDPPPPLRSRQQG